MIMKHRPCRHGIGIAFRNRPPDRIHGTRPAVRHHRNRRYRSHGTRELQVIATTRPVSVHRREQDFADSQRKRLLDPLKNIEPRALPSTLDVHLPRRRQPLGLDRQHDALRSELPHGLREQFRVPDGIRVDGDFVGARPQHSADVMERLDAATDRERNKKLLSDSFDKVKIDTATVQTRDNVHVHQLVGTRRIVRMGKGGRQAHDTQSFHVYSLNDVRAFDIQTRNDADGAHSVTMLEYCKRSGLQASCGNMSLLKKVAWLARNPRSLLRQLRLLTSYLLFRWQYGFLRVPMPQQGETALIINLNETPYKAITEGLMAQALGREGAVPVILTNRSCKWVQRYCSVLGLDRILLYEDYVDPSHGAEDAQLIESFLVTNPSLHQLLDFSFDDINIGKHALSTVLRHIHAGNVHLENPETRAIVTDAFLTAITAVRVAQAVLTALRPSILVVNDAAYTPYGQLFEVAVHMGIRAVWYSYSQRLDSFTLKRFRTTHNMLDPISLSPQTWTEVRAMPWDEAKEETFMQELRGHYQDRSWFNFVLSRKKIHHAPHDVRSKLKLDPQKKTAVIFTHVAWDASFFFGSNLFADYDEWLVETVKIACENTHLNWVIKLHPDYIWHTSGMKHQEEMRDMIAVVANVGSLPPHITVVPPDTDISTYSFFAVADYCVTVRGTVGLECPCFGIPVITAGTSRYSDLGFTENSATIGEYLEKLRSLHTLPPLNPERTTLARKHAWGLFVLRPLRFSSIELVPLYSDGDVVDHTVVIHARSHDDIVSDTGLQTFATWVMESEEEDYVNRHGV